MKRKKSTKLFDLVQALTKAEKRTFKLSISGERNTQYMLLFDELNKQTEYQEEELKKKIYGKAELETKKFDVLKHELYKRILKEISYNYDRKSVDSQLKQQLTQVRVLYSKLLLEPCKEILEQSLKLAYENELHTSVLEVLKWEKKIAYASLDKSFLEKELQRIFAEEQAVLAKLDTQINYWYLFLEQLILTRTQRALEDETKQKTLKAARENPLLLCPEPQNSFENAMFYNYTKSLLCYNENDYEGFYKHSKLALDLISKNNNFKQESFTFYISITGNYVAACLLFKKVDAAANFVEQMKPDASIAKNHLYRMYSRYYSYKLTIYSELGLFEKGLDLITEIKKREAKIKQTFLEDNYFLFAYINFGASEFDVALDWINKYLNLSRKKIRQDLENACRILRLIIAYEQKDNALLQAIIRSTYRYLKRTLRYKGLEKAIFKFIKKGSVLQSKKEETQSLVLLKDEIKELSKNTKETHLLDYLNLEAWLNAKLQNKSFEDMVKLAANKI